MATTTKQEEDRLKFGHAGGHLREAFEEWLDDGMPDLVSIDDGDRTLPAETFLGLLSNCRDALPSILRTQLEDIVEFGRTTYGAAAQALLRQRRARAA